MENPTTLILSRMITQSRVMDVIANNIANASTPGYQSLHVQSGTWLDRQQNVSAPPGGQSLIYTQSLGTWRDGRAGPISRTGNPLDLALAGQGYFTVQTASGTRLTRDGRFGLLPDGSIADANGDKLLSATGQPITIPPGSGSISIAGDGSISTSAGLLGQIGVVNVSDPQALQDAGDNLLIANTPTTQATNPQIIQGAVEGSNVQPVLEITHMMANALQFQMISQFVQAESTRQQNAMSQIFGPNG